METRPEGHTIVKIYRVPFLERDRETSKFTDARRVRYVFFGLVFCIFWFQILKYEKSTLLAKTKFWNSKNEKVNQNGTHYSLSSSHVKPQHSLGDPHSLPLYANNSRSTFFYYKTEILIHATELRKKNCLRCNYAATHFWYHCLHTLQNSKHPIP